MLAPQLGLGVFAMDLSVGHIGTAVPLLLIWLLLDKAPPRSSVPVLIAVLLAWVLVADPIVYVVGIGPLGVVTRSGHPGLSSPAAAPGPAGSPPSGTTSRWVPRPWPPPGWRGSSTTC